MKAIILDLDGTLCDFYNVNGWLPMLQAESVYRFINNEHDFTEDHTALSDARIEAAILLAVKAKHKKTRHGSRGQGWRDASTAFKALDL